ncbi:hypothetical protein KAS50_00255, partial [bacterium]|nr:hypothetical protein [bacterium]
MEKKVRYKVPEISFLIKEALSRYTALPSLYEWQEKAVKAALSGKNSLLVMPSNDRVFMCCILPMIISKKMSIIYAETEDFLKNQISLLKKLGVPYIYPENNQLPGKQSNIINEISSGLYKIILCNDAGVLNSLISSSILFDVCAVETYNDINSNIRSLIKLFRKKSVPVIFYTSNPSPEIREDIVECARIAGRDILVRDFDKPNLSFMIMKGENKPEKIMNIISKVRGQGIIFTDSAEDAQKISSYLKDEDIDCGEYIRDDGAGEKSAADFSSGTLRVLVTN